MQQVTSLEIFYNFEIYFFVILSEATPMLLRPLFSNLTREACAITIIMCTFARVKHKRATDMQGQHHPSADRRRVF